MDKASIIGVVAGSGLVVVSILLGGNLLTFFNLPGVLIVVGGTFAATSIAFPARDLKQVVAVTKRVFNDPGNELTAVAEHLVESMKVLKREGQVALERVAEAAPTGPLRKGLLLIADGTDAASIRQILQTEQRTMEEHHRAGQKLFNEMGKFAPAFGMVGTLIGLVQMLATLSDPATIGPSMAVALLTTFYGAVMANLLFLPMVTKLERRIQAEMAQIQLAMVGLESMHRGETATILQEKLRAFLVERDPQPGEAMKEAA